MADFPPEILEQIFTSGDETPQIFKHYSLVCSSWRGPAQRELFGNATLTITRLDQLVSSLASVTYTTLIENEYLCSLISTVPVLHISFFGPSPLDSKFPEFIQCLKRVEKISFSHDTKRYLFGGDFFPKIKPALLHLLQLPTLNSLTIHSNGFPTWLIPGCVHVKMLQFTDIPQQNPRWNPLQREHPSSHDLNTIYLEGLGENVIAFTNWLRGHSRDISTAKIKNASLYFHSNPVSWNYPFSLFRNVTDLHLRFNISIPTSVEYDVNQLKNLETLKLKTSLRTIESVDPFRAMDRILTWLRPFSSPPLTKLRSVQIEVFDDPLHEFKYPSILQQAANTALEDCIHLVSRHYPQLKSFSAYAPWLNSHDGTSIFAGPRTRLPGTTFEFGQFDPEVLRMPSASRNRCPRPR